MNHEIRLSSLHGSLQIANIMDSSKMVEGNEECNSNESGWTAYIASPDHKHDDDYDDDEEEREDRTVDRKARGCDTEDGGSDDSMASDASSGPSLQEPKFGGSEKDKRRWFGKKNKQQEEKKQYNEQKKAAKKNPVQKANSTGRSKKK